MSRQFESEVARHFCEMLDVKNMHIMPYNPISDSMAEWYNRTLIAMLVKTLLCYRLLLHAYNTIPAKGSYLASLPMEERFTHQWMYCWALKYRVTWGRTLYRILFLLSIYVWKRHFSRPEIMTCCQVKNRGFYDTRQRHHPYEVGDLVWLSDPTESHHNLAPNWKGPYVLQQQLDRNGSAEVQLGKRFPSKQSTMTVCLVQRLFTHHPLPPCCLDWLILLVSWWVLFSLVGA